MARVSVFQGGNVAREGTTRARLQPQDYRTSGLGEGLQAVAKTVAGVANDQLEIEEIHDQASVKEAVNAIGKHYSEIGFTTPNALFNKQGKEALETRPMVEGSLDTMITEARKGFTTERQRVMFDQAITPQRTAWGTQIAQHVAKETRTYEISESASRYALSGELARATYIADPKHGEDQIATGLSEIEGLGKLQGWGPDQVQVEKLKFTSGVYQDIGQRLAYEGDNGPELARAFVEQHRGSMVDDAARAIENHARVQENHLLAEKRRAEAEAARLAAEAKREAKERADSVARNIDDGVVVEPKDLANAMTDAQAAGDEALVEKLRQGGLKNTLTSEWTGKPLPDLEAHINSLSAEITKAGGKVNPDMLVERDHLQSVLRSSREELRSNPQGWAAKNIGIDAGPLNLDDPESIRRTVEVARKTQAAAGGGAIRPLPPTEAAKFSQILQAGNVQQKTALTMKLAKLGEFAPAAAEQISNYPGFKSLVGLATHRNRDVAYARVSQVLAGDELLKDKTKSKLIDDEAAGRLMNEYAGNAFHFLPTVKDGVRLNARSLLANDANERGWTEWGQAQKRWFAAINSALGAYSLNGVQVGGIHGFNGAATILPENVSEREFDERISRSMGPQFRKAQNGVPVADGKPLNAHDIKAAQWIPVGDGIYRIAHDGGFIEKEDGGFYEVDFRKLR